MGTDRTPADYERLSVNINHDTADILRRVISNHGITTTEAIRRAIGLLGFWEEARKNGAKLRLVHANGDEFTLKVP